MSSSKEINQDSRCLARLSRLCSEKASSEDALKQRNEGLRCLARLRSRLWVAVVLRVLAQDLVERIA